MFGSQICARCGKKTEKKHVFCPHCGNSLKNKDVFFEPSFNLGFPFNTLLKQMSKQIEKQFKELEKQPTFQDDDKMSSMEPLMNGISISISSADGQPVIKVNSLGNKAEKPKEAKHREQKITKAQQEQFSKLPKEEPSTTVRRLTDKIVYEINLPNVTKENLMINKMQNGIEIMAFTKSKIFVKLIPVSLPIMKSQLKEGKLVLELKPEM